MRPPRLGCAIVLLAACGTGGDDGDDAVGDDAPATGIERLELALPAETELDLLFVVDNAHSPIGGQQTLARAMEELLDALAGASGVPDLHIGVVTPTVRALAPTEIPGCDVDTGGHLVVGAISESCPQITGPFLTAGASTDVGQLALDAACAVQVGSWGCGFEQPFEAMKLALEDPDGTNIGFLRDTARLGVVIAMDGDDCSASTPAFFGPESPELGRLDSYRCFRAGVTCDEDPSALGLHTNCRSNEASPYLHSVQHYADFLTTLRPAGRVAVHAVRGIPTPVDVAEVTIPDTEETSLTLTSSCGSNELESLYADPAVRIQQLADMLGDHGAASSWCDQDYGPALAAFGADLRLGLRGQPCLLGTPSTAAPTCTVHLAGADPTPVAACDASASNAPCWRFVDDAAACPDASHLRLAAVGIPDAPGRRLVADCTVLAP